MIQNWKFQHGDIFFTRFDNAIGSEQSGNRPAVILQNDVGNFYSPTLIVATLTSKTAKKYTQPTHCLLVNDFLSVPSIVQAEQIFTVDKSRVLKYLGHLTPEEMDRVDDAVRASLALNPMGSIQRLPPIIRSTAAYAPPEVVEGKPPVYPYTPIKSDFEDAGTVEEMMLLANEAAAKMAREKNLPFVYRVHDKPSPEKIERLEQILLRLGVEVPVFTDIKPRHLAEILDGARGTELYPVLNVMVLRSMAKAAYAPDPIGHFGLALKDYAHFTSPIRRYPDLAIHRILSSYCENPDTAAIQERFGTFVIQAAQQSSDTEVRAITIERDCDDCYKAEYMQQHLGEIFDGIVAGVTDFGFYVSLPNTVEGLVHVSSLPESDWINDDSIAFKEEQGSKSYRLGDTVRVQCTKIDVNSGNVDFALVEEGQEAAAK